MTRRSWTGAALVSVWVALATPWLRRFLEADMVRHMLLQLPFLFGIGAGLTRGLPQRWCRDGGRWNGAGIPGLIVALGTILFWMVPRNLDAALDHGACEAAKFMSLPIAGFVLGMSWPRLPFVGRGVVFANLLSMSLVLAWAYLVAPQRICTNYRFDQQEQLGFAFLGVSATLAGYLVLRLALGATLQNRVSRDRDSQAK